MPDYADLYYALAAAKRFARTADTDLMRDFINLTQGAEPQEGGSSRPYFRPMHAAALFLETSPERLKALGGGADRLEFGDLPLSPSTLLQLQAKEDSRLKLIVPEEYRIVVTSSGPPPSKGSFAVRTVTSYE